jgi:hypothetical protein
MVDWHEGLTEKQRGFVEAYAAKVWLREVTR